MSARYKKQSFLGENSSESLRNLRVGIVGLGGGGSHIAQQLAHLGIGSFVLFDPDTIELSNLNRLVGGEYADVAAKEFKTNISSRLILRVNHDARVERREMRWQADPELLRTCDIVFGCVDGFAERLELETECRRYLMPLIDIGLTVKRSEDGPPFMSGQAVLSMPGLPCLQCLGFITERELINEAEAYGDAGERPQVVWANGVLASSAVGIAVDLVTDWTKSLLGPVYLDYRANSLSVSLHQRLAINGKITCPHFPIGACGGPRKKPV